MIQLIAMTEQQFSTYLAAAIVSYAKDNVQAGRCSDEESLEDSKGAHQKLLPQGIATPNHYLLQIVHHKQTVGHLWLMFDRHKPRAGAFVYDLEIYALFQRCGYAKAALLEAEKCVLQLGGDKISLHVFSHNTKAQHLYQQLDYQVTGINMSKSF
ncbi:GNAT family N-acetyltransferase [Agarivorans sp. TSD2052]|uniref:GNAT family N-acetyltransferase n=1 Tax=Agarivorans sp. TSD2052 TaxID=2937286 RepID=UPI00200F1749|nr:GNAT family N-acetyltransferase [Agarivorans sp. TSD2052]UPW19980.1 GNAT family N-acetyltransferase [Agarivorans sp. TSD2052]